MDVTFSHLGYGETIVNLELEVAPVPITQGNILVVEDEFLIRTMLAEMLREAGFTVVTACDGDEALAMISSVILDLIITDVRMPGSIDGIQLVAKVRESHKDLPIIVTSGHLTHFKDVACDRTDFVAKPYDFASIIELVERELPKTFNMRAT